MRKAIIVTSTGTVMNGIVLDEGALWTSPGHFQRP
jgi:hypothetical protein